MFYGESISYIIIISRNILLYRLTAVPLISLPEAQSDRLNKPVMHDAAALVLFAFTAFTDRFRKQGKTLFQLCF